jgi:hypothetical protein
VKLAHFPLLTDENIDAEIVRFLRGSGFDVCDVLDRDLDVTAPFVLVARRSGLNVTIRYRPLVSGGQRP